MTSTGSSTVAQVIAMLNRQGWYVVASIIFALSGGIVLHVLMTSVDCHSTLFTATDFIFNDNNNSHRKAQNFVQDFSLYNASSSWMLFFESLKNDTATPEQARKEQKIAVHLQTSYPRHEMMARFPLGPVPVIIETNSGKCLVGSTCSQALRGHSSWSPDPHIRDILMTVLLKCAFRTHADECFVVDVGSNVGAHSLAVLHLGARVVSIEAQTDLCVASRLAAEYAGLAHRIHFICGGVSVDAMEHPLARLPVSKSNYRYGGNTRRLPYANEPVPLYALKRLIRDRKHVHFLKIDTDSIDCHILQQAINLMSQGVVHIHAMTLETWDESCKSGNRFGKQLRQLVRQNFTVHRTLVYERSWDNNGWDYENSFKRVALPKGWTEKLHVGFNFVLWCLNGSALSDAEVEAHPIHYPKWQYLFTKGDDIIQTGYRPKSM
jgi:FkbM family methyltransferase